MENEVDILGTKFSKNSIVNEDGTFTTFGLLLIIGLSLGLFRYFILHPNQIREIVFGKKDEVFNNEEGY